LPLSSLGGDKRAPPVGREEIAAEMADPTVAQWFLTTTERGNPATGMDRRHDDEHAWTEGNLVTPLIHGRTYFDKLYACLRELRRGDTVWFTDWRGDAEERLVDDGTTVGDLFAELIQRGVDVRGLVWRSHPDQEQFSEQENVHLGHVVNESGGQVLLDQRVRRAGCHHQKLVVIRHPGRSDQDVAFAGGIDLCRGRRDDERHRGDPQEIRLGRRYEPRPGWHDVQVQIRGPAIADLAHTFSERWEDPTPLDHRNPWRAAVARFAAEPIKPTPLPSIPGHPGPAGPHAVQILRTYPAKRPPYPFAPRGERSVARGYIKALSRARSLIYLEDQYLWSKEVARVLAGALRRSPDLRLIAVVPPFPDRDGLLSGPPNRIGQEDALRTVNEVGKGRVAVYHLENEDGSPIYVHAKVCVVDDVWAAVGSDNLNRRSWTHDSEITCAVLDESRDLREPADPGGAGDGARVFARDLRLTLWREHLGSQVPDSDLVDPRRGFEAWELTATSLEAWHRTDRKGPRPPGRARVHAPAPVPRWARWWARPAYEFLVDPDGRPRSFRRSGGF
jgi:phosphatidylserine/phosphatidylglycerophosphate/cardiolipin synthase-like enzyme